MALKPISSQADSGNNGVNEVISQGFLHLK